MHNIREKSHLFCQLIGSLASLINRTLFFLNDPQNTIDANLYDGGSVLPPRSRVRDSLFQTSVLRDTHFFVAPYIGANSNLNFALIFGSALGGTGTRLLIGCKLQTSVQRLASIVFCASIVHVRSHYLEVRVLKEKGTDYKHKSIHAAAKYIFRKLNFKLLKVV